MARTVVEVDRIRNSVRSILVTRNALVSCSIWLFVWGTGVLMFRMFMGTPKLLLLSGCAGLLPMLLISMFLGARRTPAVADIVALVDKAGALGGRLMFEHETGVSVDLPRKFNAPRVHWNCSKYVAVFAAGTVFLCAAFAAPRIDMSSNLAGRLDVENVVTELKKRVDVLEKDEIVEEESAEKLRQALLDIQENSNAKDPAATWEALDHVAEQLSQDAEFAAEKARVEMETMSVFESLCEDIGGTGNVMQPGDKSAAMEELAELLRKHAEESDALGKVCREALNGELSDLDAEDLARLAHSLKAARIDMRECLGRLCNAGLLQPGKADEIARLVKCDDADLAAFLDENGCACLTGVCECCVPGRGGVNRGRGDAPMTWTDGTDEANTGFKETVLSPAALSDLKDSKLVGMSYRAPSVEEESVSVRGALAGAAVQGGAARTRQVLPCHRTAIREYFSREKNNDK